MMSPMWQDYVFTFGALVFSIALIPALRSNEKPPIITSLPTATLLVAFAATYLTLHLWFSAIASFTNGIIWGTLAFQAYTRRNK
jgi:hypothetical protein